MPRYLLDGFRSERRIPTAEHFCSYWSNYAGDWIDGDEFSRWEKRHFQRGCRSPYHPLDYLSDSCWNEYVLLVRSIQQMEDLFFFDVPRKFWLEFFYPRPEEAVRQWMLLLSWAWFSPTHPIPEHGKIDVFIPSSIPVIVECKRPNATSYEIDKAQKQTYKYAAQLSLDDVILVTTTGHITNCIRWNNNSCMYVPFPRTLAHATIPSDNPSE